MLTPTEREVLLVLFKDFSINYNANSLSKKVQITPRGALKILKNLQKQRLLLSKQFGKAIFYKANLDDYYAFRTLETLLISEAREKAARWLAEFRELFKEAEIVIIFGSIIREPTAANDIDLVLVFRQQKIKKVNDFISQKNRILLKPIHPVKQSPLDLRENLKKRDPVIMNAVRRGYVLHGYETLIGMIKDVTRF